MGKCKVNLVSFLLFSLSSSSPPAAAAAGGKYSTSLGSGLFFYRAGFSIIFARILKFCCGIHKTPHPTQPIFNMFLWLDVQNIKPYKPNRSKIP